MDSWLLGSLGAAGAFGLGVAALEIRRVRQNRRIRRQIAAHRRRYPALHETWDAPEVTSMAKSMGITPEELQRDWAGPFPIPAVDLTPREHIIHPGDPLYARVVAASRAEIGRVIGVSPDMLDLTPYRLTDTDAADAMPPPPNIGGEGNPPYAGPNYVHEEEIAADMKAVQHEYVPGQTPWAYLYENGIPLGTEVRIVGGQFQGERGVVRERYRNCDQARSYGVKLLTGPHAHEKGTFVAPENHLAL